MTESQELYDEMAGLLSGIGLSLVELDVRQRRGSTQVRSVVYRPGGTGIDECVAAHRIMQPRLSVLLGVEDFHMEVASPGIDRTFKSAAEYSVFVGRGVRLFLDDESVVAGRLVSSDGSLVLVASPDGTSSVPVDSIRKCKLDDSQEGR